MKLIWAFDVGSRCGWASGEAGGTVTSGAWVLKSRADHPSIAGSNLLHTLNDLWGARKPSLVVKEAPLALQAFAKLGNAAHTVAVTLGLHAIIEAMCVRFGVPFENVHNATIRKHFTGRSNWGNRDATKRAIINRAKLLKYVPADCTDDDRCDALAVWDYATAAFKERRGGALYLFGEEARA